MLAFVYTNNTRLQIKLINSSPPPGAELLRELKKLDDKVMLVEVQLLESKVYHALGNLPKSRSVLEG